MIMMTVSDELRGMWKETAMHYFQVPGEGVRKATRIWENKTSGRESNSAPTEYESGLESTKPRYISFTVK
jgi:hypothetical protein